MNISEKLKQFYEQHRRDLPWRHTSEPYKVWLSGIILQQTRVVQGVAYYQRFIQKFPTINDLAAASEDEVLKLWQGLGYYSRARNLHYSAKFISSELKGIFPDTYENLIGLKGVGRYTASAVLSISYNQPYAVVDGNVYRVLSRLFNVKIPIDSGDGQKYFITLADKLLDRENPGNHNQAIMEFGALQCIPQNPDCENCIFVENCEAYGAGKVNYLPVKEKAIRKKDRYFYLFIIKQNNHFLIRKRKNTDIWKGLYEFPLIEDGEHINWMEALHKQLLIGANHDIIVDMELCGKPHPLTHQTIHSKFVFLRLLSDSSLIGEGIQSVNYEDLTKLPVPKIIEKVIVENEAWFLGN